jgi:hypothetical protein
MVILSGTILFVSPGACISAWVIRKSPLYEKKLKSVIIESFNKA